jgi:hypothetical protein
MRQMNDAHKGFKAGHADDWEDKGNHEFCEFGGVSKWMKGL